MNYNYRLVEDETYEVVETNTTSVVKQDLPLLDAKKISRFLNLGGGFDGFTPDFFLNTFKVP